MDDFVSLGPLFFSLPEEVMQCACNYTMAMAHVLDFFDLYVVQCIHIKSYKLFFYPSLLARRMQRRITNAGMEWKGIVTNKIH